MARGGRPKPKKRSASEFARIYGSRARVSFVKSMGCVFCSTLSPFIGRATMGECHNAHTETGGMGRKADYTTIVPLCASHHRRYDEHAQPFDKPELRELIRNAAPEVERRWQAWLKRNHYQ